MTVTPVELQNVNVSTVKPSQKSDHPTVINVSLFDLPGGTDGYIPILFLYKPDGQSDSDSFDLLTKMKTSLGEVLVPYYPFAGRWVKTYDEKIRQVLCNDEGVPFIEAYIDEEMDNVVDVKNFEAVELLAGYEFVGLDIKHFNHDKDQLPSVFVQTTRFKCGGVALNVSICHMAGDGNSMFTFIKAWSEIALHGYTSIVPIHDRSLTTSAKAFLEGISKPGNQDEHVETEGNDKSLTKVDPGAAFKCPEVAPMTNLALDVRREIVEQLKAEAVKKGLILTTVDLITAHLWRSYNAIPNHTDKKASTVMGTFLDGRKRFHSPPLPEHFAGNAIVFAPFPRLSKRELAAKSHLETAALVHEKVRSVNTTNWRSSMLETMGLLGAFHECTNRLIVVTSWFRFPMYDMDFGCGFGKPVYATSNFMTHFIPTGIVVIQPPPPSRSKDTIATVHFVVDKRNGVADALFSNRRFRHFFHDSTHQI